MPQLPESVTIVTRDGEPRELHIDGAEFPWYISEEGVVVAGAAIPTSGKGETRKLRYEHIGNNPLVRLDLTILVDADRLEFKEEAR